MTKEFIYRCSSCGKSFSQDLPLYTCPSCDGNLDVCLDFSALRLDGAIREERANIWRYEELLPVATPGFEQSPLHRVGWTPLYRLHRLEQKLGLARLWAKDESSNPSASFKDRASALVVARALALGIKRVVAASTGNAGAAMACMAASCGLEAVILAPRTAPPAKLAQLLAFGARVLLVNGNYDDAFELSLAATREFGWYNRNTGFNPFTVEGKKTAAFEIWEQVLRKMPTKERLNIFIPVGDGNILSGLAKGFVDLLELGWIEQLPRLIGVQAEGSASIARAFDEGKDEVQLVQSQTLADSISVNLPRDGNRALARVRQSGGAFVTVSDAEILEAIPALGSCGLFVEPAAAASLAGLKKALQNGLYVPNEPALLLCTGSGLKDVKAAGLACPPAPIIEPSIQNLKEVFHG